MNTLAANSPKFTGFRFYYWPAPQIPANVSSACELGRAGSSTPALLPPLTLHGHTRTGLRKHWGTQHSHSPFFPRRAQGQRHETGAKVKMQNSSP